MLTMKKQQIRISNQEEFNKHLQHTSPATWIVLGLVVALLIAFFAWSFLFKLTVRFSGQADIVGGEVTLHITNSSLRKIKVGSKIYINDIEGEGIIALQRFAGARGKSRLQGDRIGAVCVKIGFRDEDQGLAAR